MKTHVMGFFKKIIANKYWLQEDLIWAINSGILANSLKEAKGTLYKVTETSQTQATYFLGLLEINLGPTFMEPCKYGVKPTPVW